MAEVKLPEGIGSKLLDDKIDNEHTPKEVVKEDGTVIVINKPEDAGYEIKG